MPDELVVHDSFSPSKLERIEVCPPSWKICDGFVSASSTDASRGTLMHEAFYDDTALAKLNDSDRAIIENLREEHIKPFANAGVETYHEFTVIVCDMGGNYLTRGTLDYLMLSKDRKMASLIDLKFGNYEVEPAETNIQIWAYVAGVFQEFKEVETVYALIVQPVYGIGNYDHQAKFERADLPRIVERIYNIIAAAKKADLSDLAQYHCGKNCRYCNKAECAKYRQWMRENMQLLSIAEMPQEIAEMTLEYADKVKVAAKAIADEMKPTVELADKVILESGGSEHYIVCKGKTTRRTNWKGVCEKFGISDTDIAEYTTESVSNPYLSVRMRKTAKRLANGE